MAARLLGISISISINLILLGGFYDVALRDFGREPGITVRAQQQDLRPGCTEVRRRVLTGVPRPAKGCARVVGDGDQLGLNYPSRREPSLRGQSLFLQPVKLGTPGAHERSGSPLPEPSMKRISV